MQNPFVLFPTSRYDFLFFKNVRNLTIEVLPCHRCVTPEFFQILRKILVPRSLENENGVYVRMIVKNTSLPKHNNDIEKFF